MSPRTNNYLSLCLSQANQSPLHYRHGAIIVRGGKVIGQGFNTYRPGFDGGCLKTGVLPSSTADGHAIAELKMRVKTKTKMKENPKFKHENQQSISGDTFVPFEEISTGVGGICAGPLSMHSEMMAIQSALSLSSGAQSSQARVVLDGKTADEDSGLTSKLSVRRQRHSEMQAKSAVAREAPPGSVFKSRILKPVHLNAVTYYKDDYSGNKKEKLDMEKQNVHEGHQSSLAQYQYKSSCVLQQQTKTHNTPDAGTSCDKGSSLSTLDDCLLPRNIITLHKSPPIRTKSPVQQSKPIVNIRKDAMSIRPSVSSRIKDPRLNGADLYVARLGKDVLPHHPPVIHKPVLKSDKDSPISSFFTNGSKPRSLHDELLCLENAKTKVNFETPKTCPENEILENAAGNGGHTHQPSIRASRPCYRCVGHMHAVGIKRVFWTNADGEWEGAKVRDLVDAIDGEDADAGLFVTKHEVLMLRRVMESNR